MVDMDSLKHVLTGAGAILIVFSVFEQIIYSGCYANYGWQKSYLALFPGRYGAYYQLSIGIVVMGLFALICFLVYLVFVVLDLSIIQELLKFLSFFVRSRSFSYKI